MKAVIITNPGKPEVLQVAEIDRPIPVAGEVLIKVYAAGVNRPDVSQRKGNYLPPKGASPIPGLEVAGTIEEIGADASGFDVDDKVCALITGGGYAEYCVAPSGQCLPVPDGLSFAEAASLPETYFTVWSNVFDRAKFKSGEHFLVHGGSSGIGVAAVQLVKAFGGTVYTTAGSDEKCRFCEQLGADKAINYHNENFADVIMTLTHKRGVDVILDMIGGPYTQPNLEILADDGRLVLINFMKGDEASVKLSAVMRKRLTITGSTLRARDVNFKKAIAENLMKYVWPLFKSGKLKPVIYQTVALAEASRAHEIMEESSHMGKIILLTDFNS